MAASDVASVQLPSRAASRDHRFGAGFHAAPADDTLNVSVLGPIELWLGLTPVDNPTWHNRERVRQLLAYLTIHPCMSRRRVAAALWPEFGREQAAANLRVTLNHLQRVLEPDRSPYAAPRFVRCEGDMLRLASEIVHVDLHEFERMVAEARSLENRGEAPAALAVYQRALTVVRGEYLADFDQRWADMERLRVGTLVLGARCRAGELLLDRGEPEHAARLAAVVLAEEPLQERAGRLLARAVSAQGDRAAARRVILQLVEQLAELGLAPEPETRRTAEQHGVGAGRLQVRAA